MVQKDVVTPTPHQRVLGVSNGPKRIQRPVSHQKPVSHVSIVTKSTHPANQNVNPAAQKVNPAPSLRPAAQQNQQKMRVPSANPESEKPTELAKLEKPQSKYT